MIAFLLALQQHHGLIGPHLLMMPLSVISSWKADITKFGAHNFDLFIHRGDRDSREEAFGDWYRGLKSTRRNRRKIALFVTTYELALKDEHLLARLGKRNATVGWEYLIVSELPFQPGPASRTFIWLRAPHCRLPLAVLIPFLSPSNTTHRWTKRTG